MISFATEKELKKDRRLKRNSLEERYWRQRRAWLAERGIDEDLYSTAWLLRSAEMREGRTRANNMRDGRATDKHIKKCPVCHVGWEYPMNDNGRRAKGTLEPIFYDIPMGYYKTEKKCPKCEGREYKKLS